MQTQASPSRIKISLTMIVAGSIALSACGQRPEAEQASDLEWVQSRTGETRYAYIETHDLTDEFIFGASVIKVDDFFSNALNMVVRPTNVKLKLRGTGSNRKLEVVASANAEKLMTFSVNQRNNRNEIDFASAGNDLTLRSLVNTLGGMYTAGSEDGYWVSTGVPSVSRIQQDKDTMVVDLLHTVSQAVVHTDIFGRVVVDRLVSDHPGKVTVRVFLTRKISLPRLGASRTIAQGRAKNVGYFGTSLDNDSPSSKIQRFALGDANDAASSITFYLKDVPAEFKDTAEKAILSWNKAFDAQSIKVADAPDGMDVGDPRFNVVKWFDGLDEEVNWAGVAKMLVEPDTGLVMGGNLYLNGGSVLGMYKNITAYSETVAQGGINKVSGTIGSVEFDRDEGETPVIPFISDLSQDYESYMQGYYLETIAHEVGHVLGLRHNFRGTTALVNDESASVMDYAPRAERAHYKGPGFYDIAAIKWGYFGKAPATTLPFCTDEDIWSYYDCNQGDWGNAVDSSIHGLLDGTLLLTQKVTPVTDDVLISSMAGSMENVLKIKKFKTQLPASSRAATLNKIDAAYDYLYNALPDVSLTGADLEAVKANLVRMRDLTKKKEEELRTQGRI